MVRDFLKLSLGPIFLKFKDFKILITIFCLSHVGFCNQWEIESWQERTNRWNDKIRWLHQLWIQSKLEGVNSMSDGTSRLLQAEEQFRQSAHFFPAVPRPRLKSDQACSTFVKPRQLKTKVRCSQTTDLKEKCKLILFMRYKNAFLNFGNGWDLMTASSRIGL